ncbi:alpha/beta fold hydrolase [Salisaeta longa]|uniref:alpha/beta fold hydrolase n=1 Tax=Salisaeta longa TaxID=503170 RepID=UPI0003B4CEFC|nr:alpha/beta fold hydrolase [Salisaeta longa]
MDLFYKQYGKHNPPLIILHGLLGASGNWHTLSRNVFKEKATVYAVDQRNHGRSPHHETLTYEAMADDIRDFIHRHALGTVTLLGHSMGGKTAMQTALSYPGLVDRLIVADMAPKAYPPHHTELLEALAAIDPSAYDSRSAIDEALAEDVPSFPIRQFLLKNLAYEDGTYRWQMNLGAIRANYEAINAAITSGRTFDKPTLFVRGGRSDYVADADLPAIRGLFPHARLETIADAGHWVHADAPDAFARLVMDFLAD